VLQRGEQLHVAEFVIVVVVLCRWTDTQTDDMTTKSSLLAPHRSSDTQVSDAVAWNNHSFFVRSIASKDGIVRTLMFFAARQIATTIVAV